MNNNYVDPKNNQAKHRTNKSIYRLVISAIFAAFVYVFTLISIPVGQGYVHLGDVFILLSCVTLGWWAVFPAVIGSALADLTLGFAWWIPATVVIKGIMAILCVIIGGKFDSVWKTLLAFLLSSLFMQAGYLAYQSILVLIDNPAEIGAIYIPITLLLNMLQTVVCVPVALVAVRALRRLGILDTVKNKI